MTDRTCSIAGCERKHYGLGLCQLHWRKLRQFGDPLGGATPCVEQGCAGPHQHRGVCDLHRFMLKVHHDPDSGCWVWQGDKGDRGYGRFKSEKRRFAAHRWSYEHFVGPIPDGLVLDHLCRVHACVNPAHLEAVTQQENTHRGVSPVAVHAKQTICTNGHDLSEPHAVWIDRHGWRVCRACDRERKERKRRARDAPIRRRRVPTETKS
jgi:hypothetical protein